MSHRRHLQPITPPLSPIPPRPKPMSTLWRVVAACVLVAYVLAASWHASVTPVDVRGSLINAPDEPAHRGYVRILVEEHRLPTIADRNATYEWHQPPLYYTLAAPFGESGARGVSILIGLLALVPILLTTRLIFPGDPALAVVALGFAALLPMHQAITGAVGNDGLIEAAFSWVLYLLIVTVRCGVTPKRSVLIGLALGAAILAKLTALLLIPVAVIAAVKAHRHGETSEEVMRGCAIAAAVVVLVCSWWFVRNAILLHEPLPLHTFNREFASTQKASDWIGQPAKVNLITGALEPSAAPMTRAGYLRLLANWTFRTFFAAYTPLPLAAVGVPRFPTPQFYLVYLLLAAGALFGLCRRSGSASGDNAFTLNACTLLIATLVLVAASHAAFTWTYFQAQGRYLYPAMLPLSIFFARGIRSAFPKRYQDHAALSVLALMAVLALAFLVTAVVPAYEGV